MEGGGIAMVHVGGMSGRISVCDTNEEIPVCVVLKGDTSKLCRAIMPDGIMQPW